MKKQNPFLYSDDNKRYHTWNYYLKHHYHHKVFKVALNASFSCPNRDGTCGVGGCTFCGSLGSGECAGEIQDDLLIQFQKGNILMAKKWPDGKAIAYFQAYSNTYASLDTLKQTFEPFVSNPDVLALSIATRADCLEDDVIHYLDSLTVHKDIWIELGLQSIHDKTATHINRGHDFACFLATLQRLQQTNLKICVHLINSLPWESKEMMMESAQAVAKLPIHALKIHMLHLMRDTQMAQEYEQQPFPILTRDEYVDIVIAQLEVLPPQMIIQRLTGDGIQSDLLAPDWTRKKVVVLNEIDKEMLRRNTWQGKHYERSD